MSGKYFLDTNILVYAFDAGRPGKRERALALIGDVLQSKQGIISTQVVQEFLNVATRKFTAPLKMEDARIYLQRILIPLCQVYPDQALYETSLELQQQTGYSFYDALILAGALRAGCEILYSEDLQDGRKINGLTIVNPFKVDARR